MLALVRYIHLNPIRAGVVASLDALADYRWCGHRELLQAEEGVLAKEEVLSHWSHQNRTAGAKYLQFMADGLNQTESVKLSRGGKASSQFLDRTLDDQDLFDERFLGGGAVVEKVLANSGTPLAGEAMSLSELISKVAGYFDLPVDLLCRVTRVRRVAAAKAVVCHVALRHLDLRGVDLSAKLQISPSAVSHAAKRGRTLYAENEALQRVVLE